MSAKTKIKPFFEPKLCWLCEECGQAHDEIKDPPDSCTWCGYRYFANLADELKADTANTPRTA